MQKYLGVFSGPIYALMRIVVGLLFACHGAQKLFGALGGEPVPLVTLIGLGGVIEFFGGLCIMLGVFTSWAAFLASGMMAVAYFMVHQPQGALPIQNRGEMAAAYCWVFLYIASRGAGSWSLARALGKDKLS